MSEPAPAVASRWRGLPDKRLAILRGGLAVFARDGYSRASMDMIAAAAEVSSRTVYNHFHDKLHLFEAVIQHSARQVSQEQLALIEEHLGGEIDLPSDLVAFARAWAGHMFDNIEHFTLVRKVMAEVGHVPTGVLESWQETGPRPVQRQLALRMRSLMDRGMLRGDAPDQAAGHFMHLTVGDISSRSLHGAIRMTDPEIEVLAAAGVDVFLHGYTPRPPLPSGG